MDVSQELFLKEFTFYLSLRPGNLHEGDKMFLLGVFALVL